MKHPQPERREAAETATAKNPSRTRTKGSRAAGSAPTHDEGQRASMVRETAYALYLARGCAGGYELDDWLQAEAQVSKLLGITKSSASTSGVHVAGA